MCPLSNTLISFVLPILIVTFILIFAFKKRKQYDVLYMQMMERQKEAVELLREIRDLLKKTTKL